jgi:hypothetical protein
MLLGLITQTSMPLPRFGRIGEILDEEDFVVFAFVWRTGVIVRSGCGAGVGAAFV